MARGNFKRCRVLLGSNTNEGHYFIMYFLTNIFKKQVRRKEDFLKLCPTCNLALLTASPYINRELLYALIKFLSSTRGETTVPN